jgi:hypothetical protein
MAATAQVKLFELIRLSQNRADMADAVVSDLGIFHIKNANSRTFGNQLCDDFSTTIPDSTAIHSIVTNDSMSAILLPGNRDPSLSHSE